MTTSSDASRNRRIDALFTRALELEGDERQAFLDRACNDSAEREAVGELLCLSRQPDPRFDAEAFDARELLRSVRDETSVRGARVGAYRLLRKIGRGGMAVVYLAERADGEFEQRVALKVVRPGYDNRGIVRRFERERQILASLSHPSIARLLDGGCTDDGTPYFVMEYVEGEPIDRYCEQSELDLEQRLRLFIVVARAVQYAHRNLILHRDLKPSNIVVTADGEVKLLDFGIAKPIAEDEETLELTKPAERFLTPRWSSPEQFAGERVTTASDIYQLGLLLYRLLTGGLPFASEEAPAELAQAILHAEPERPSAAVVRRIAGGAGWRRARRLEGDLDTLLMAALRKEPERRYATVEQLIADIENYLDGRALSVRPDAWGYRLKKFVRRNLAATAMVSLVLALLVGYAVTMAVQANRLAREAAKTERVKNFLTELFSQANPETARGSDFSVTDLVRWGAVRVREEFGDEPEIRAELLSMLGALYVRMGRYDVAESLLSEAMEAAPLGEGTVSNQTVQTARSRAETLHYLNLFAESERLYRLILAQDLSPLEGPAAVRGGVRAELADLLHTRGRYAEAEAELHDAMADLRRVGARSPDLVKALRDLGNVQRDRGDLRAGEASYREALRLADEIHGMAEPQAVIVRTYFGQLLISKGDYEGAEALLMAAQSATREIYAEEHSVEGMLERTIGLLRLRQGRLEEARSHLERARGMHRRLLGENQTQTLRSRVLLAELSRQEGDLRGGRDQASRALRALEEKGLGQHRDAFSALAVMARSYLDEGRDEEAEPFLWRGVEIGEAQFVSTDPATIAIRELLSINPDTNPSRE